MAYGSVNVAGGGGAINVQNEPITTFPTQKSPYPVGDGVTVKELELNNFDDTKMTLSGTTSAIAVDTYTAYITPKAGFCWPDGTRVSKALIWRIISANTVEIPNSETVVYTYSGNKIYFVDSEFPDLDSDTIKVSGSTYGTNVSTYTVKFNLRDTDTSIWTDGTISGKSKKFKINKKYIKKPTVKNVTFANKIVKPTYEDFDSTYVSIKDGSVTEASDVGTYSMTFVLSSTKNLAWEDSTTAEIPATWQITQKVVTKPIMTKTEYDYLNGDIIEPKFFAYYNSKYMSKISGYEGSAPGDYDLVVMLNDSVNSKWNGTTDTTLHYPWKIINNNDKSVPKPTISGGPYTYDTNEHSPTIVYNSDTVTMSGTTVEKNVGIYNITFSLNDTIGSYWEGPNTSDTSPVVKSWAINKAETLDLAFGDGYSSSITLTNSSDTFYLRFNINDVAGEPYYINGQAGSVKLNSNYIGSTQYGTSIWLKEVVKSGDGDSITYSSSNVRDYPSLVNGRRYFKIGFKGKKHGETTYYFVNNPSGKGYLTNYSAFEKFLINIKSEVDESVTGINLPEQGEAIVYDGNNHQIKFDYDSDVMTISGTITGKDAGDYTVTFSLKSSTSKWTDGTSTPKQQVWKIEKRPIEIPTIQSGVINTQTFSFTPNINYDHDYVNIKSGDSGTQTTCGTHTVVFDLIDKVNTHWDDTNKTIGEKSVSYEVKKYTPTTSKDPIYIKSSSGNFTIKLNDSYLKLTDDNRNIELSITKFNIKQSTMTATLSNDSIASVSIINGNNMNSGDEVKLYITGISSGTSVLTFNFTESNYNKSFSISYNVVSTISQLSLNGYSKAELADVIKNSSLDEIRNIFNVGDYRIFKFRKTFTTPSGDVISSEIEYKAILIGIWHNSEIEGTHLLHFAILKDTDNNDIVFYGFNSNNPGEKSNGWFNSEIRRYLHETFLKTIDMSHNYLDSVIKVSSYYTDECYTLDNIFLLNNKEAGLPVQQSDIYNGTETYEYFQNGNILSLTNRVSQNYITNEDGRTFTYKAEESSNQNIISRVKSSKYPERLVKLNTNGESYGKKADIVPKKDVFNPIIPCFVIGPSYSENTMYTSKDAANYTLNYNGFCAFINNETKEVNLGRYSPFGGVNDHKYIYKITNQTPDIADVTIGNSNNTLIIRPKKWGLLKINNCETGGILTNLVGIKKITSSYADFKTLIANKTVNQNYNIGDYFEFRLSSDIYDNQNNLFISKDEKLYAHIFNVMPEKVSFIITRQDSEGNDSVLRTVIFNKHNRQSAGTDYASLKNYDSDFDLKNLYLFNLIDTIEKKLPSSLQNIILQNSYEYTTEISKVKLKLVSKLNLISKSEILENTIFSQLNRSFGSNLYVFCKEFEENASNSLLIKKDRTKYYYYDKSEMEMEEYEIIRPSNYGAFILGFDISA